MLAKTTVLEIVHEEGQRLQAAAHARAEAVHARPRPFGCPYPQGPRSERAPSPKVPTAAWTRRRRRPPRP
jgi:hypothetical protein